MKLEEIGAKQDAPFAARPGAAADAPLRKFTEPEPAVLCAVADVLARRL